MIRSLSFALALWPSIAWAQIVGIAPVVNDSGLTQETRLYYGKMTTGTTIARNFCIDAYVRAVMTGGSWAKSDAVYLLAANAQQTALLNLRNPGTYTASVVNNGGAMTFTANAGFTSDGSAYIDSGFNPTTASGLFALNSNHMAVWSGTDAQNNNSIIGNVNTTIIPRSTTDNFATRNSDGTTNNNANTGPSGIGYFAMSRSGGTGYTKYQNGAVNASVTQASSSLTNANFFINARTAVNVSTLQTRLAKWGSALSDAEQLADYNAASAYLSCI